MFNNGAVYGFRVRYFGVISTSSDILIVICYTQERPVKLMSHPFDHLLDELEADAQHQVFAAYNYSQDYAEEYSDAASSDVNAHMDTGDNNISGVDDSDTRTEVYMMTERDINNGANNSTNNSTNNSANDNTDIDDNKAAKPRHGLSITLLSIVLVLVLTFVGGTGYLIHIKGLGILKPHETHATINVSTLPDDNWMYRVIDFNALKARNPDIVAWLDVPGTGIDDKIVAEPVFNQYKYDKTTVDGVYDGAGEFLIPAQPADAAAKSQEANTKATASVVAGPDELTPQDARTMILGHSLMGVPTSDDWRFTQLPHRWGDKSSASDYQYIYIYTPTAAHRYRLVWGSDLNPHSSAYMMPYTLGSDDYADMLADVKAAARYTLPSADGTLDEPDRYTRTVMLSTCNYAISSDDFERFVLTYVPDVTYVYGHTGVGGTDGTIVYDADNHQYALWRQNMVMAVEDKSKENTVK